MKQSYLWMARLALFMVIASCKGEQSHPITNTSATHSATATQPATVALAHPGQSVPALPAAPPSTKKEAVPDPPRRKVGEHTRLSPAALAARRSYLDALTRGRKATVAKDYPTALAAFSEALTYKPDDARATSEHGYAELLSGNLDAAASDFDDAEKHAVADNDLLGQILFNAGMVHEKKGELEDARALFARAALVRPSAAVEAKLAGKSRCTARIKRGQTAHFSADSSFKASDFDALWVSDFRQAQAMINEDGPLSEEEAKKAVCVESSGSSMEDPVPSSCEGSGPWRVSRDHYMYTDRTHFIAPTERGMLIIDAGMVGGGACSNDQSSEVVESNAEIKNGLLVITSSWQAFDFISKSDDDSDFECKDGARLEYVDYYDLSSDNYVSISSDINIPSSTLDGKTIVLSGEGCDERIDISK